MKAKVWLAATLLTLQCGLAPAAPLDPAQLATVVFAAGRVVAVDYATDAAALERVLNAPPTPTHSNRGKP